MTDVTAAPAAPPLRVTLVGGGPAGLMAAEVLAAGGARVDLFDAMPSVGRKFLLAGKGGLNLTHGEPLDTFVTRFRGRQNEVASWLAGFDPAALRDWAAGLGVATFVGSSGRVFPTDMKAAPLLRAWLRRLREAGVQFHMRHRWLGPQPGDATTTARFATPHGEVLATADALLLALGGGSWARLGSDGAWVPWLQTAGVDVAPLQPANCGFDIGWSPFFAERFAGAPMKSVRLRVPGPEGGAAVFDQPGEFVVTATGIEGSLVYAASAALRECIAAQGSATVEIDLCPGRPLPRLAADLARGRGARSLANHLREHAGLEGVKAALLREQLPQAELDALARRDPADLARRLKAWPLTLRAPRPLDEAISSAGGVRLEALDERLMARERPGLFCAGEMLDWEAPTGGYLLTASIASARVAAAGALAWCAAGAQAA